MDEKQEGTQSCILNVVFLLVMAGPIISQFYFTPEREAWKEAQEYVRAELVSPSTAVFGGKQVEKTSVDQYRVSGWVDAQNRFGATVRSDFVCELKHEYKGKWSSNGVVVRGR